MGIYSQTVSDQYVSVGGTKLLDIKLTEVTPPNWPFGGIFNQPGVQTTNPLTRGLVEGSAINLANINLTHVCDFKFIFNFGFNLFGLTNPALALQQAIRNGKIRAANAIRAAMNYLVNQFRTVIKTLLQFLGFDPTGIVSLQISLGKDLIRQINEKIKEIAQFIEDVAMVYYLIKDIQAIVQWIASLPAKIQALLKQCLTNFQNSLKQVTNQIAAIPGQVTGQLQATTTALTQGLAQSLTTLQNSSKTQQSGLDPSLLPVLNGSTSNADLDKITTFIKNTANSAQSLISTNTSDTNKSGTSP